MRSFVRSSFALVGLSTVLSPVAAHAQNPAPAGYAPASGNVMVMGIDGKPVMAQMASTPMPVAAPAPHAHKFRTLCANCAKKQEMAMPAGRIVACAHSKNGVCPTCQALLAMPGTVTMGSPAAPAIGEAPGRAMVSNTPSARPTPGMNPFAQSNPVTAVYNPSSGPEPTPIGVMQTNYAQPGMVPTGASSVPTAASLQPGHALAESGANPAPFQHKSTSSVNPHILGHIFGYSGRYSEWREEQNNKKAAAHASIPYNNEGTTVNEIPASMVYGHR